MVRFIAIAAVGLVLAGCVPEYENRPVTTTTTFSSPDPTRTTIQGSGNPASEFCVQQGGRVELRQQSRGTVGYCHTNDGRVIEEWAYFRGQQQGEYVPPAPPVGEYTPPPPPPGS